MAEDIPAAVRVQVITRDRWLCVRCACKGTDLHHRRRRAVKDEHRHCTCNLVLLCRACHGWAHGNPFLARGKGIILSHVVTEPFAQPANTAIGALLLDCNGGFTWADVRPPTSGGDQDGTVDTSR